MAISWTHDQRLRAETVLMDFPVASNQCVALAQALVPIAQERDPNAHAVKITPRQGRYVLPDKRWFHHVTTACDGHYADALTGVAGHPVETYLPTYFPYPEMLKLSPTRLEDLCP